MNSTIALHWINSTLHTIKTFVTNRVVNIQTKTSPTDWRHALATDNPAILYPEINCLKNFCVQPFGKMDQGGYTNLKDAGRCGAQHHWSTYRNRQQRFAWPQLPSIIAYQGDLFLGEIDKNHRSLPSVETKTEPIGTLYNRRTTHGTQQTHQITTNQSFFQRTQHAPKGSRHDSQGEASATQPIS